MAISAERKEWFENLKLGMMIHWGIYSHWGITESWPLCSEDKPWCVRPEANYIEFCDKYRKLNRVFNPVRFDPENWADKAVKAGMKYVVFTTKHHDGFCLFDTKTTDYKITHSHCPYSVQERADITGRIVEAFREKGLGIGFYFSKADWNCNDYWAEEWATPNRYVNYDPLKFPERWRRFVDFTRRQIEELMTNYGKIDILWLDAGWVRSKEFDKKGKQPFTEDIHIKELTEKVKEKQPDILVVDRFGDPSCEDYITPENRIPDVPPEGPWESCMTIGDSWSFKKNDRYKSVKELITNFLEILCKGGNLLLNVGPDGQGLFPQPVNDRLSELGAWMDVNRESVYQAKRAKKIKDSRFFFAEGEEGIYAFFSLNSRGRLPRKVMIYDYRPEENGEIRILGDEEALAWERLDENVLIEIPSRLAENPPCSHYVVFFLKGAG